MSIRVFTRDIGQFKAGTLRDWPITAWMQIAQSEKIPIDYFSEDAEAFCKKALAGEPPREKRKYVFKKRRAAASA